MGRDWPEPGTVDVQIRSQRKDLTHTSSCKLDLPPTWSQTFVCEHLFYYRHAPTLCAQLPQDFEMSRKVSLTHHQAQCPAYSAQRTAAEHLRATRSNDKKQRIAAHNKLKSMVCNGCHYQCYGQSERLIQLFPGSQVGWYGQIVCRCPHVNGCSISWR